MLGDNTWIQQFLDLANQRREQGNGLRLDKIQEHLEHAGTIPTLDQVPGIAEAISRYNARDHGMVYTPPLVTQFVSDYLSETTATSVLDPNAGLGSLLATIQRVTKAEFAIGYEPSVEALEIGRLLNPAAKWSRGHFGHATEQVDRSFDVVASVLPFSAWSMGNSLPTNRVTGSTEHSYRDLGFQILIQSSKSLTASGVGIFVTTPNFFFSQQSPFRRLIDDHLWVEAAIALPPGTFEPLMGSPTYIVVIRRTPQPKLFVGGLSASPALNELVVRNLKARRSGDSVELGRLVNSTTFHGLDQLRISEQIRNEEKRFGAGARHLIELMTDSTWGQRNEAFAFDDSPNAIYLPTVGLGDVVTSPTGLHMKPQNYLQVIVDPAKSDSRFIAHFLNTELGRSIRSASRTGTTIGHTTSGSLKTLQVFVPLIEKQHQMLAVQTEINAAQNVLLGLQNEIATLQADLWSNSRLSDKVNYQLGILSRKLTTALQAEAEQSIKEWTETLPFPLASILGDWQTTLERNIKDRYELLLHFFEACVAFHTIVLLSAFGNEINIRDTPGQSHSRPPPGVGGDSPYPRPLSCVTP